MSQGPSLEVALRNKANRHIVCMSGASREAPLQRADVTLLCADKPDAGLLDHPARPSSLADEEPGEEGTNLTRSHSQ